MRRPAALCRADGDLLCCCCSRGASPHAGASDVGRRDAGRPLLVGRRGQQHGQGRELRRHKVRALPGAVAAAAVVLPSMAA